MKNLENKDLLSMTNSSTKEVIYLKTHAKKNALIVTMTVIQSKENHCKHINPVIFETSIVMIHITGPQHHQEAHTSQTVKEREPGRRTHQ